MFGIVKVERCSAWYCNGLVMLSKVQLSSGNVRRDRFLMQFTSLRQVVLFLCNFLKFYCNILLHFFDICVIIYL